MRKLIAKSFIALACFTNTANKRGNHGSPRAAALGIAFTTFALLILVETLGIADRQGNWNAELIKGATASAVIGLFGGCWFCASILYWNRRKKIATLQCQSKVRRGRALAVRKQRGGRVRLAGLLGLPYHRSASL